MSINNCPKLNRLLVPLNLEKATDRHGSSSQGRYPTVCQRTSNFQHTLHCSLVLFFAVKSVVVTEQGMFQSFSYATSAVTSNCAILQLVSYSSLKRISLVKVFSTHIIRICRLLTTRKEREVECTKPFGRQYVDWHNRFLFAGTVFITTLFARREIPHIFWDCIAEFSERCSFYYSPATKVPTSRHSSTLRKCFSWLLDLKIWSSIDWSRCTNILPTTITGFI